MKTNKSVVSARNYSKARTTFGDLHLDRTETGSRLCWVFYFVCFYFNLISYVLCTPETSSNRPVQVLDLSLRWFL